MMMIEMLIIMIITGDNDNKYDNNYGINENNIKSNTILIDISCVIVWTE